MEFNLSFQDVLEQLFSKEGKVYFIGEKFDSSVALGLHKDSYVTYFIRTCGCVIFYDSIMPLTKGLYTQKYACVSKEDFEKGVHNEKVQCGPES